MFTEHDFEPAQQASDVVLQITEHEEHSACVDPEDEGTYNARGKGGLISEAEQVLMPTP
jgi:hypothetical protein